MRGYGLLSLVVAACSTAPLNAGNTTFGTVSSVTSAETGEPTSGGSETGGSESEGSDPTLQPETSADPTDDSGESDPSATQDSSEGSTGAESTGGTTATESSSEGGPTDSGPMETTGGPDPLACSDGDLGSSLGDAVASGSTAGAVNDITLSCAGGGGVDAIYAWTAPAAGTYTFDLSGSSYDTAIGIFDPDCAGAEIACNDDDPVTFALTSSITVDLGAGQEVLVVVDGYMGAAGSFVLDINSGGGIDFSCADGGNLGGALGNVASGSTAGTDDSWNASCQTDGPDVAYGWTAPAAASYTFSLAGSSYDTVMTLQSPDCGGVELSCDDDTVGLQSEISIALGLGESVLIVIDGYNSASGTYTLAIN